MISPYALLNASRPKSPASVVTAYDLFSAVQSRADAPVQPAVSAPHYIREIGLRHSSAANRTVFSAPPLD